MSCSSDLTHSYIREVSVRYSGPHRKVSVRTPEDVCKFFRSLVGRGAPKEHFLALYLDGRHQACGHSIVSIGTATSSLVHPREVFQPGLVRGATCLMLGHNHPSGNPEPSPEDRDVTERLKKAGEILGIAVLDHIVFSDTEFVSFRERGLL